MKQPISSFCRSPLALSLALLGAATSAQAATFTVTSTADSGEGSLRAAVAGANADTTGDSTIVFSNQFGQPNNPQTIALTGGVLVLSHNTSIIGPGARTLTLMGNRDAGTFGRLFNVAGASVSISGFTLTGGNSNGNGGAILNQGTLRLSKCALTGNFAAVNGGALYSTGPLSVSNCTFSGNTAGATNNASTFRGREVVLPSANGGALFSTSTTSISTSSFGGNTAPNAGGALYNSGTLTISDSTIAGNTASVGGGVFNNKTLGLSNSIIALNAAPTSPDLNGTVSSGDFNLIEDPSGAVLSGSHNITGQDPLLGNLQNNGGQTDTFAPQAGSPALDAGQSVLARDQRQSPRPVDLSAVANTNTSNGSDIGAVELDTAQSGTSFVVNTLEDRNDGTCGITDCTLREAVAAAPDADSFVTFASNVTGTLTLNGSNIDLARAADVTLTIQGPGASVLTLSGGGKSNVFGDDTGSGTAIISGLTFSGGDSVNTGPGNVGRANEGGAIDSDGIAISLADCVLSGNHSTRYGGAIDSDGPLTLERCTFSNNVSDREEGAVYIGEPSSATDCVFSGNKAIVPATSNSTAEAGAVGAFDDITFTRCTFSNNSATANNGGSALGGAVESSGDNVTFTGCTFTGNTATATAPSGTTPGVALGGALVVFNTTTLSNCTLSGNSATNGSAIYNDTNSTLNVVSSTLSGNSGNNALFTGGTLTLRDSTLSGNTTAVRVDAGTANIIQNTIVNNTRGIIANTAANGATLLVDRCTVAGNTLGLNTGAAQTTVSNTLLVGNATNFSGVATRSFNLLNVSAAQAGLETDASGKPLLKNNGGPTQTVALLAGSPVINKADPAISGGFDQRGPNFSRVVGGRADIGAFEFQTALAGPTAAGASSAPRS